MSFSTGHSNPPVESEVYNIYQPPGARPPFTLEGLISVIARRYPRSPEGWMAALTDVVTMTRLDYVQAAAKLRPFWWN